MKEGTSDFELVKAYLAGDAASFDALYERYKRPLYSVLCRTFRGQEVNADDVFQSTWVKAIGNFDKYEEQGKFFPWLVRIAHNQAIDFFRACASRGEESIDGMADGGESIAQTNSSSMPDEVLDDGDLASVINDAVDRLSPPVREVFLLRREGMSFKEIAVVQACSVNTCLARMQYALKNLRNSLKKVMTERQTTI